MGTFTLRLTGGNVGLPGLLFVTFLILKLTHVIEWSWWWVTAPLWISAGILIMFAVVALAVVAIVGRR